MKTRIAWVLRAAIALTFVGHGFFAITGRVHWLSYLTAWGFSIETSEMLLPIIGWTDMIVALLIVLYPHRVVVLWAILWTIATALSRPLSGEHFMKFIERGANIGAPIALYYLLYFGGKKKAEPHKNPD